jgi:hypothetical protein
MARPGDGKPSFGDELRWREAAGESDGSALTGVELEGRLLVTQRSQAFSLGVGPTYLHWLGPAAISLSLTPALGGEYFDRTVLATAGLRGGLGLGLTLAEGGERGLDGFGLPDVVMPNVGRYVRVIRRRTLLTLELTGAADVRSRGGSVAAGLLVGLAWSDERFTEPAPPLPAWPFLHARHD